MKFVFTVLAIAIATVVFVLWRRQVAAQRAEYIRHFELPRGLFTQLQKRRPELALKDCQLVAQGLRQFFHAYLAGGRQQVSMPSQVADDLWHEFILFTRNYQAFCRRAFGGFLHHTPAVVLSGNRRANAGLRRVWWHSCRAENIRPGKPARLPLIFALDAKLGIAGGFLYAIDCQGVRSKQIGNSSNSDDGAVVFCAGDFASSSVDGSTDGFGDASHRGGGDGGGDGGGSSDGGGCGGGGCGS